MTARKQLQSAADVIEALGGLTAVAELTASQYKAVANWKAFNAFPPKTYVAMIAALRRAGRSAPASLWGMVSAQAESA